MNGKNIIIILIILGFAGLAFYSIQGVLTPYVSFAEAIQSGSSVQVIGKLDRTKAVRHGDGFYTFSLMDEGNAPIDVLTRAPCPSLRPFRQDRALGVTTANADLRG
jgi:hypothetical protein